MEYHATIYINDKRSVTHNIDFIADSDHLWWWTNHIEPVDQQDPWIKKRLFFVKNNQLTYHPWSSYVKRIKQGEVALLEDFLLFPYVYQSLKQDNCLHCPITIWYPNKWVTNGQHKLIVWHLLGKKFDVPILWQSPKDTQIKNAIQLTGAQQLVDLIQARVNSADPDTRAYFHIRDGCLINLSISINWVNPWNSIKDRVRHNLSPAIHQLIVDSSDQDPIEDLLLQICQIPTTESL